MSPQGDPPTHSSPTLPNAALDELPPLPKIRSEQLTQRIFTHCSLSAKREHPFQAPGDDANADNEELGHIGDQALGLAITDLIQALYPHLHVGPASQLRDVIKRKDVIAKICVSYRLHEKLRTDLPQRQARDLRNSTSTQVDVFKAYVGGVYRDQGQQAVSEWLNPLFQSRVEAAYQGLRNFYHPPTPEAVAHLQPSIPSSRYSSPGIGSAFPNHFAENHVATRHEGIGDRSNRRRRQQPSSREGGIRNGEGKRSQRRRSSGPDATESARKRAKSSGPDAI